MWWGLRSPAPDKPYYIVWGSVCSILTLKFSKDLEKWNLWSKAVFLLILHTVLTVLTSVGRRTRATARALCMWCMVCFSL